MMTAVRIPSGAIEAAKWFALVAMTVDHVDAFFFGRELPGWTAFGRLAFPLFALVVAYNLARPGADASRSIGKLLVFGVIAAPFHYALTGAAVPVNIMATFAASAGIVALCDRQHHVAAGVLFASAGVLVEYHWPGLALVVAACWFFRESSEGRAWLVAGALLSLVIVNGSAWHLLAVPVLGVFAWWAPYVPRNRWAFWTYYPGHLALFALVLYA